MQSIAYSIKKKIIIKQEDKELWDTLMELDKIKDNKELYMGEVGYAIKSSIRKQCGLNKYFRYIISFDYEIALIEFYNHTPSRKQKEYQVHLDSYGNSFIMVDTNNNSKLRKKVSQ